MQANLSRYARALLWTLALCLGSSVKAQSLETVASGLRNPWSLAFLPEGRFLVTLRGGELVVIEANGTLRPAIAGVPKVAAGGQGGLLDVLLDSDFERNRALFFCFSEPAADGRSGTAVARATLSADRQGLNDVAVIFRQHPKTSGNLHYGCRMAWGRPQGQLDGTLFVAMGERYKSMDDAQRLNNHMGKVIRIKKDGSVPPDNPLNNAQAKAQGALPEIWSWGHRNPQGLITTADGQLWEHEHGPQGGDEVNLIEPSTNYGWPVITYGENYGGGKIGAGITSWHGMAQPAHVWVPSIAPSGVALVTSDRYGPIWKGSLIIGSLKFADLYRVPLLPQGASPGRDPGALKLKVGQRVRDVRQGPDGYLYLVTDDPEGRLLRVVPRP
ncbi:PQQ-dependent sugar dehydrogenase [Rhodoferax aquaticus]|uniref:PQQ-dependent sugar dehydrogenase n=1 Tax=Rhodoferax aquaticus TaxID=2527691 RepID=A0A515EP59_9BURK|nr:PQQ-dependent sugar dehydrogenase [Rhodoferax aquaticus]QDL54452.1 PQQ-dependent sugar dehydrogenase [Rhodoferax aquaticus]